MSEQKGKSAGSKYDAGKPGVELLDRTWLVEVAKVLDFGKQKYAAHNWRQGIEWSRCYGAALRHVLAAMDGEDLDSETGLLHVAHASCCLMFLTNYAVTHRELDDRHTVDIESKNQLKLPYEGAV